ncbi:cytochrome-b5 reductase [Fonticula alba]|uniref:Cytochrome-b5 reductase n=1 Tax=Fonticula alba TaxID=691883 RepID=A0A058Z5X9_FONAL|nr:cytochrome-b5 reductase [Fonticula alba]KCV68922.1 cytochrome-b5 reductase [Fonticula alba]|eukprot:XP_009496493.1 cytochrome-b5 reductase [Fonticula alba]
MSSTKTLTMAEVAKHNTESDCYLVINGNAYDVTKFLDNHPGGQEIIVELAGTDATDAFADIGHSLEAQQDLENYLVGPVSDAPKKGKKAAAAPTQVPIRDNATQPFNPMLVVIPLVAIMAIAVAYFYK